MIKKYNFNIKTVNQEENEKLLFSIINKNNTSIDLSEYNINKIPNGAFAFDKNLKSIKLPKNIKSIGEDAFYYCERLESIVIPDSVTSIGPSAFAETGLKSLEIPSTVTTIGKNIIGTSPLIRKIVFPLTGGKWTTDSENTLHHLFGISTGQETYAYSLTDVVINGGTTVGDYCFSGFDDLKRVELGDSITTIGEYAFDGFYDLLEFVKLGKNLKTVAENAFYDRGGSGGPVVENVYFNGTLKDWCGIQFLGYFANPMLNDNHLYILDGNNSFFELTSDSFETLEIPEGITEIGNYQFASLSNIKEVIIPEGITRIGNSSLRDLSLSTITIPSTVVEIGSFITKAGTINFAGTKDQWEAITKNSLWNYYSDAKYVRCSDGQVYL